jgi:hypothetical protein
MLVPLCIAEQKIDLYQRRRRKKKKTLNKKEVLST